MDIEKVLKSLTLEEKASLCQGSTSWLTKSIDSKGIPSIMMTDGPHGLRKQEGKEDMLGMNASKPATCFPSAAAMSNSWDKELIYEVGEALGEEALKEKISVVLGPGVNIKRSPLCGRNFEYFSEDPFLSSEMAKNHIRGLQSKGVGASIKHFAVNNQETRRMSVNAVIDERALREIYLASFESAIKEAKPYTVMAAYDKVNGEFCCENQHLLKDILRDEWGYEGVVVSDWGATNDQVKGIPCGFDLRMPYCSDKFNEKIVEAVRSGRLSETDLDNSVRRILTLVKKGVENRVENYEYSVQEHHALAVRVAAESAVLLKNEGNILPASRKAKIAVIGGFAKNIRFQGGGSSHVNATYKENVLEVLDRKYPDVKYTFARGYRIKQDKTDEQFTNEAVKNAQEADIVILYMGLPDSIESEGFDRKNLDLPKNQIALLKELKKTGKPIAVVLFAGAPVLMDWDEDVQSVFAMYTGGQGVAEASLELIFGEVNPCGRLSETYPLALEHTPCSLTYPEPVTATYSEGIYVGYRYYEKKKLPVKYAFGHGLSYTEFSYDNVRLSSNSINDTDELEVLVDVSNMGKVAGKEVVQLYVSDLICSVHKPVKELKGFTKIYLKAGEKKTVKFRLNKRSFAYYNTDISDWYAESGEYEILIGSGSDDIRVSATVNVQSTTTITKTYDEFVTMGEIMNHPACKDMFAGMIADMIPQNPMTPEQTQALLDDEDSVVDVPMDFGAMGLDMPLRKTADMAPQAFTDEMVEGILNMLNSWGKR